MWTPILVLIGRYMSIHRAFNKRSNRKYGNKGQSRKLMQFSAQKYVGQLDLLSHSLCFWREEEGVVHNPQTNLCCFCNTAKVRLMNMLIKLQWEFWHYFITSTRLESNNTPVYITSETAVVVEKKWICDIYNVTKIIPMLQSNNNNYFTCK